MTPRERVRAALRGASLDRPPVSFWGHFYERESSARDLVDATLEFHRTYQWDWVKLNPRKHYHVEPWEVRYRYSGRPNEKPVLESWPIKGGDDWARILPRPIDRGAFAEQIEAVRMLRQSLPADVPFVETVFTPLAVLGEMVEKPADLKAHLASHPELVTDALEAVTVTYERFVPELLRAGADGIYFATVDWASRDQLTPEEYRAWARPWDRRLIEAAAGAEFNVLHVCKRRNLLAEVADYPVSAFSWAATDSTNPSLADGLRLLKGAVMGGLSYEGPLLQSDPAAALEELRRGFDQTAGRRWLVAPGCSIPPTTPSGNLRAIREAVEAMRLTPERSG
jgi:uroporphyrinogen decarboxylase